MTLVDGDAAEQLMSPLQQGAARRSLRTARDGGAICLLSVPDIRCGGCVSKIERALNARDDVASARVNLSLKRVQITPSGSRADPALFIAALDRLGFAASAADDATATPDPTGNGLLRATAVAGFGAMNIMLLSVAVWSGALGTTRDAFHLLSAMIAVPVVLYAGQPFFSSAWSALRVRRVNMDVPITLAVLLATVLSLAELLQGGEQLFFDAAVTLLFFLLGGRYLDQMMRERASSAINGLARLAPSGAMVRRPDGALAYVELEEVKPGDRLVVSAGEYVPVDAQVSEGSTDLDRSLITGEPLPVLASPGDMIEAGTLNLTGSVEAVALRPAAESFLAQMIRMQSEAERNRGTYERIANRAARLYAPVVHLMALLTFLSWLWTTDGDWQQALFVAISVLIITCPCALGLAVPVAHVVAAGRLMRMGVLMKDGAGIERLANIDAAVFDKTGTLTTGRPRLEPVIADVADLSAARGLAIRSSHPAAKAIAADLVAEPAAVVEQVQEVPGYGIEGRIDGRRARLGRGDWVAEIAGEPASSPTDPAFAFAGGAPIGFEVTETLRDGVHDTFDAFSRGGLDLVILSGDSRERVMHLSHDLVLTDICAGMKPADKVSYLENMRHEGRRPLMVGDGLNDAGALAAAHVSMAPSSASDAGRTAADFVFLRKGLDAVAATHRVACRTAAVVRQNFTLAICYNCIAIPLAVAGLVTPLIAALAMSASSILVIGNSLRLSASPEKLRHGTRRRRLKKAAT
ncbi:heavy metal translocating P-type ATPase [Paracoccus rhizosphaerae]|nr:heavy metal translocating P-type ATPase [Paracoccus rhizosphaerae]